MRFRSRLSARKEPFPDSSISPDLPLFANSGRPSVGNENEVRNFGIRGVNNMRWRELAGALSFFHVERMASRERVTIFVVIQGARMDIENSEIQQERVLTYSYK